jgi:hypothetical protein
MGLSDAILRKNYSENAARLISGVLLRLEKFASSGSPAQSTSP